MKLNLTETQAGTILSVKSKPNARRNEINGMIQGMLKISVTATPEKSKANRAIIDLLAKVLAISKSQVELISGQTNASKKFMIHGITGQTLRSRLDIG